MAANALRDQRSESREQISAERQNISAARVVRSIAFAALLVVSMTAPAESQSAIRAASGRTVPVAVPGARFDSYTIANFRASAATRQWPLVDGQSASHRFQFVVRDGGIQAWDVQCHRLTITGDEARNRTSLDCMLVTSGQSDERWRLQLAGASTLDGSLHGRNERYDVRHAGANEMKQVGGSGQVSGYYIYSGDALIAAVELQGWGLLWIDRELGEERRQAVSASLIVLLAGHDQRRT